MNTDDKGSNNNVNLANIFPLYFFQSGGLVKERPIPQFTVYIVAVSPDDGRCCRPKHVVNKSMLELHGVVWNG